MEDAMIINKSSDERGFAHGSIYKSEFVEVDHQHSYFCRDPKNARLNEYMDTDGLPIIGTKIQTGDPLYCYYSADTSNYVVRKFGGKEDCYVHSVKLCGDFSIKALKTACITFRVPVRNDTNGHLLYELNVIVFPEKRQCGR